MPCWFYTIEFLFFLSVNADINIIYHLGHLNIVVENEKCLKTLNEELSTMTFSQIPFGPT